MICRNHVDVAEGVRRCTRCGVPFCRDCTVDIAGHPYCATCKTEQLLDVRSGVDPTVMNRATILRRFGAALFDGIVIGLPITFLFEFVLNRMLGAVAQDDVIANMVRGIPATIVLFLYEVIMVQRDGQTFGKKVAKVRIVRPDGSPISAGQAWGRTIAKTLLAYVCLINYIVALFDKDRRALHDMLASTRVNEVY